jgi:hypothetical protein
MHCSTNLIRFTVNDIDIPAAGWEDDAALYISSGKCPTNRTGSLPSTACLYKQVKEHATSDLFVCRSMRQCGLNCPDFFSVPYPGSC